MRECPIDDNRTVECKESIDGDEAINNKENGCVELAPTVHSRR